MTVEEYLTARIEMAGWVWIDADVDGAIDYTGTVHGIDACLALYDDGGDTWLLADGRIVSRPEDGVLTTVRYLESLQ